MRSDKEAPQTRPSVAALSQGKLRGVRAGRPDPSRRKERLLGMTSVMRRELDDQAREGSTR